MLPVCFLVCKPSPLPSLLSPSRAHQWLWRWKQYMWSAQKTAYHPTLARCWAPHQQRCCGGCPKIAQVIHLERLNSELFTKAVTGHVWLLSTGSIAAQTEMCWKCKIHTRFEGLPEKERQTDRQRKMSSIFSYRLHVEIAFWYKESKKIYY
jgi:hypothetical protein